MNDGWEAITRRYRLWCTSQGYASLDEAVGKGHLYIIWCNERWREWKALNGYAPREPITLEMHEAFDNWLEEAVSK